MNLQHSTSNIQRSSKPQAPTGSAATSPASNPRNSNARPTAFRPRMLKFGAWRFSGCWRFMLGALSRFSGCWMLVLGISSLHAAPASVRLKLGTLAPAGTTYHKSLQAMGEKWRKVSDGAVQLTIFPGGTQGSEADMVGLMQTGNLDA